MLVNVGMVMTKSRRLEEMRKAFARRDVQEAVGPERDLATVVVGLRVRMRNGDDLSAAGGIGHARIEEFAVSPNSITH